MYLTCHVTSLDLIIEGWGLLTVCHHPDKSCDCSHCGSGNQAFNLSSDLK